MTSRDFCYWLQGYFEIAGHNGVTETQSAVIQKHLALVFKHEIDPSMPSKELDKIHNAPDRWGGFDPTKGLVRC